eukprot:1573194-Rhodomonas_salina.2
MRRLRRECVRGRDIGVRSGERGRGGGVSGGEGTGAEAASLPPSLPPSLPGGHVRPCAAQSRGSSMGHSGVRKGLACAGLRSGRVWQGRAMRD